MKYTIHKCVDDKNFGVRVRGLFLNAVLRARSKTETSDNLPRVVLPTGNTPLPFYKSLRDVAHCYLPPFEYCQLDEYIGLPDGDERLFSKWLEREVLDPLKVKHRMIFNSAVDPQSEVKRIQDWHKEKGPVDLAVLGMGENGHVGFNEPGAATHLRANITNLSDATIKSNESYGKGVIPKQAITLGIGDLMLSKETILLVRGEKKADMLFQALFGAVTENVPASYLQNYRGRLTIIGDDDALKKLPKSQPVHPF
jgi:glucosamine-6-phosphate deaminase